MMSLLGKSHSSFFRALLCSTLDLCLLGSFELFSGYVEQLYLDHREITCPVLDKDYGLLLSSLGTFFIDDILYTYERTHTCI